MASTPPEVKVAPREALRRKYRDELDSLAQDVPGGKLDGVRVVRLDDVEKVLTAPLPPLSLHGAEVTTPGRVDVTAICPQCDEKAEIAVAISTELRVEDDGATLRVKGKSKAASHVCGQESLPFGTVKGQESFELEDIVGDDDEPQARPKADS